MRLHPSSNEACEAVGVFDNPDNLQDTIEELGTAGFGRHQISVLGSDEAVREEFGRTSIDSHDLEDNPHTPRSPIVAREELGVAQGVLMGAGLLLGTAIGGITYLSLDAQPGHLLASALIGGIIGFVLGSILAAFLKNRYVDFFQHQIDNGGLLLWVQVPDGESKEKAEFILKKHGAHDVHIHNIAA